ncbi:hypothetical protein SSX86_010698 [Deinandra increscens subsp. villosa]|uniref:PSI subunit V n=1 Tax=Deinandra increscens subsp. villosa TaxID=3103831 RepID=A0AAP0DFS1_9ASTR
MCAEYYGVSIDGQMEGNNLMVCKSLILAVSAMLAGEKLSKNPLPDNEVKQAIELLERAGKSTYQVIQPINSDPFIGSLETPVTSSPLIAWYLSNLLGYRTAVNPLLRGIEVGLAHGFFLVGPFEKARPLRNTEYAGAAGSLAAGGLVDLADNRLTGSIPVSNGSTPGLDMLIHTKHFHFGGNMLSGPIPQRLFNSNMTLIHVLFENNRLTGTIPNTLGLVNSLEVIWLDRNFLTGNVPSNINNLTGLFEMFLSNNQLTDLVPNLTGLNVLNYLDLSNNTFDPSSIPSWFSTLQSLTTLKMSSTNLVGQLPAALFNIPQLQNV